MASIDNTVAASKCPLSPMNNKQRNMEYACLAEEETATSHSLHLQANSVAAQIDSATVYIMKKAASSIWGMIQDFGYGNSIGTMEGTKIAEVNAALSATISPYFHLAIRALQPNHDFGDHYSHDSVAQDDEAPPITSDISDSSSCEQNMEINEGGLKFQSADFNADESNQRLDYVITQVDISRMTRTASRHLDVESILKLPTITYRAKNPSICSSHIEDDSVDEFLLRNAQIIEDYFDSPADDTNPKGQTNHLEVGPSQFSWMMIPKDVKEEAARVSNSIQAEELPDTISICKSHDSMNMEYNDDETFEYCAVCQEPFQDGELLRVLPCQHLFHCGCIGNDCFNNSGCSMCKKTLIKAQAQPEECTQEPREESLPPWAFARLGNLLPGFHNENPSID